MASKKVKDLAVKTGSYTDSSGAQKGRYLNVGSMMKSDDGSFFLLLNTTFNPAGVPNPDNRDNVLISVFDLREQGDAPAQRPAQRQAPATTTTRSAPAAGNDFADDDIPF